MKCPKCGSDLSQIGVCENVLCDYILEKAELPLKEKDDIIKENKNSKEKGSKVMEDQGEEKNKIWDMTFKTLLLETPKIFLPLIKEVFDVEYSRERKIVLLNNEYYNKEEKVITDTTFRIGRVNYHFECQFSNDKTMVVRMFEYDFQIGMTKLKEEGQYLELEFPKSCVMYITGNKKLPKELKMRLKLQNGESIEYKVPTVRVQDYSLEEIEERKLVLFLPFLILRYTEKLKNKKRPTEEEISKFYEEMIKVLNKSYEKKEINEGERIILGETLKKTEEYALRNYPEYKERVEEMMEGILKLESVEAIREARKEGEEIGKKIGKKIGEEIGEERGKREKALEMLESMKEDGVEKEYIKKLAKKQGLTEEEIEELLK